MKIFLILFLILPLFVVGQSQEKNTYWLARSPHSTSYIQLKKRNKVTWIRRGCIHKSEKKGSWSYDSDTLTLIINSDTTRFLKTENKLCHIDEESNITKLIYCIPETKYKSYFRVKMRGRKLQRKSRNK